MGNNKKEKVEYNPTVLMKNFIIYQLLILYITLNIGDMFSLFSEFGNLVTRYMPVAVVTLISTFIIFKNNASKCLIKDKEEVEQKVKLGPVIVSVILLLYGLYSVESNMSSIKSEMNSSYYSLFMSSAEIEDGLREAATSARINWLITSIVYLITAECVGVIATKRLNEWLKDEEPVFENEETLPVTSTTFSEESLEVSDNNQNEDGLLNGIKWNL